MREQQNDAALKEGLRDHLFTNTIRAILFTLLLACLVVVYLNAHGLNVEWGAWWLGGLGGLLLFRLGLSMVATRKDGGREGYYLLMIVSGLFLGAYLGYFYWSVFYQLSVQQRTILFLFLAGLMAGSTITMASSRLSFATFIVPMVVPILLRNLQDFQPESHVVAVAVSIYLCFLVIIFMSNQRMLERYMVLLVRQSALNKQLEMYNQRLSILSTTDELTRLPNRRHFLEHFEADWSRAQRTETAMALLVIDIDYFKECNDRYGHLYGDNCLRQIGSLLLGLVRRHSDLAARYGGDELVVLLYDTTLDAATEFATRIQQAMGAAAIENKGSPLSGKLTLSIGVASMVPVRDADSSTLFSRADQALYQVKAGGKNGIGQCLEQAGELHVIVRDPV